MAYCPAAYIKATEIQSAERSRDELSSSISSCRRRYERNRRIAGNVYKNRQRLGRRRLETGGAGQEIGEMWGRYVEMGTNGKREKVKVEYSRNRRSPQ